MKNKKNKINKINKINNFAIIAIIAIVLFFSAFITINEKFFKFNNIPTWSEIYYSAGINGASNADNFWNGDGKNIYVNYIDVGQGDCELIKTREYSVLIDCGELDYYTTVLNYLDTQKVEKLDYVVVTHPHSDHMGGMSRIIDKIPTENIIMPDVKDSIVPTTSAFINLLKVVKKKEVNMIFSEPGMKISLDNGAEMDFFSPVNDYNDLNNYSVVFKLIYGQTAFLFTGDIENPAETDILNEGADLSANVLKVAHHGSTTSSKKKFLRAVGGTYAVIGVGSPNSYGHPNKETLENLSNNGYEILRTDLNGNIVFMSNGKYLEYITQKGGDAPDN